MTALELKTHNYKEAVRYYENAQDFLKTKARKEGSHYQDPKYVRIACGAAYSGVLLALDTYLALKGVDLKKGRSKRKSVDDYRIALAKLDKKLLTHYNDAYEYLHLVGYYDGNTNVNGIKAGMDSAVNIISKIKPSGITGIKK